MNTFVMYFVVESHLQLGFVPQKGGCGSAPRGWCFNEGSFLALLLTNISTQAVKNSNLAH